MLESDSLITSELVRKIFPDGSIVVSPKAVGTQDRYWVIPGKNGYPRWILPENTRMGIKGLKFWWPYDTSSQFKWIGILTAYQTGNIALLPGVQRFGLILGQSDWSYLGYTGGTHVRPVIYLSDPLARGKAITFLIDASEEHCRYVAKQPVGESAVRKILHEAASLTALAQEKSGIAPRVLFQDVLHGVAGQSVCPVRSSSRRLSGSLIDWLLNLKTQTQVSVRSEADRLCERLQSIREDASIDASWFAAYNWPHVSRMLQTLTDSTPLPSCWIHGDFAPWNFKRIAENKWIAIDWEEARQNGLPFYDLIHYCFIQAPLPERHVGLLNGMLSNPWVRHYMQSMALNTEQVEQIFRYFLLDYWCRRLEDRDFQLAISLYQSHIAIAW